MKISEEHFTKLFKELKKQLPTLGKIERSLITHKIYKLNPCLFESDNKDFYKECVTAYLSDILFIALWENKPTGLDSYTPEIKRVNLLFFNPDNGYSKQDVADLLRLKNGDKWQSKTGNHTVLRLIPANK